MEWIEVTPETMPTENTEVLVTIRLKYPFDSEWETEVDAAFLVWENGKYEWEFVIDWDEGQEIEVTHWMPFPEPPDSE